MRTPNTQQQQSNYNHHQWPNQQQQRTLPPYTHTHKHTLSLSPKNFLKENPTLNQQQNKHKQDGPAIETFSKLRSRKIWPTVVINCLILIKLLVVEIILRWFFAFADPLWLCIKVKAIKTSMSIPCIQLPSCQVWVPLVKHCPRYYYISISIIVLFRRCMGYYDLNSSCYVDSDASVTCWRRGSRKYCLMSCHFWCASITFFVSTWKACLTAYMCLTWDARVTIIQNEGYWRFQT